MIVYGGSLGGYPDTEHGGTINFALHPKLSPRCSPACPLCFSFNTGAGLPIWLRIALLAYLLFLAIALFSRPSAGRFTVLIALSVVAVLPTANMLGWMTQWAQQGRYVYHSAIWILIPIVVVIGQLRRRTLIFSGWIATMCAAALFSELVYVRMGPAVQATVADAAAACQTAACCRAVSLQAVPRDWRGAFYFHAQVRHDLAARLPGIAVDPDPIPARALYCLPAFPGRTFLNPAPLGCTASTVPRGMMQDGLCHRQWCACMHCLIAPAPFRQSPSPGVSVQERAAIETT